MVCMYMYVYIYIYIRVSHVMYHPYEYVHFHSVSISSVIDTYNIQLEHCRSVLAIPSRLSRSADRFWSALVAWPPDGAKLACMLYGHASGESERDRARQAEDASG